MQPWCCPARQCFGATHASGAASVNGARARLQGHAPMTVAAAAARVLSAHHTPLGVPSNTMLHTALGAFRPGRGRTRGLSLGTAGYAYRQKGSA